ncbi:hypothetical protein ECL_02038 [Enterobacter cloacae subsp. cloacae ATCC 13047]|uniref:Uncharacterized protein n=1 Tax=Enterobacter cloacae subsp. cloacae (strain ATCC 13047 / DSM 30054 / NBRC 13535 / NCTC 10005 / WDCM 00083 / NCDC 279-56) TaxID=716541 RepID=A0A0H3CIZ2_ENTCC|nr:hypothetical protein ECL_02038 [Enterobacter cloacae subsp. cloacae ATCC 13047]
MGEIQVTRGHQEGVDGIERERTARHKNTSAMHFSHGYYDNNSIVPATALLFE